MTRLERCSREQPVSSKMALVAMPMVPFTWPISVHTFASIITGIPGVYMNKPGQGHFVPSSCCDNKSSNVKHESEVDTVRVLCCEEINSLGTRLCEVPEASTVDSLTGRIAFDNSIEPRVKN